GKNGPSLATTLSADTGAIGDTVHDSATLTGATGNAGGTVTYTAYTDDSCSAGARDAGTKTVTNGIVPNSNGLAFNSAGTFYWQGGYSGGANKHGAGRACGRGSVPMRRNRPAVTEQHSPPVGA